MDVTPAVRLMSVMRQEREIMNATIFKTPRCVCMFAIAIAALLNIFVASAADTPASATAPAVASVTAPPADANQQGGRGNRANVQRGNFGGGGGGIGFNLDDKQRELLQEARQVNGDDLRKLNEKLSEAQKEFVKVVVAEKYDEKIVREKADAVGRIQAEIMALNGKAFATVAPTLKPEQRETLEGNVRVGVAIVSPGGGLAGPGGNFVAGPGGGRVNFNTDGGAPGERALRRNDPNADNASGRGGNTRRRGGAPDAPAP